MRRSSATTPPAGVLLGGVLLLLCAAAAPAQFIWDGSAMSDLWTTNGNWVGGTAPAFDLAGDALIFGATGGEQQPDAGDNEWLNIASLAFTGADAKLRLIGTGSLTFEDGATITNDSTFKQRIDIDLIAQGDDLIIDAATGKFDIRGDIDIGDGDGVSLTVQGPKDTELRGVISGSGTEADLIKLGAGTLTLTGANTYGGTTRFSDGTIFLGNNRALGDSSLRVIGDAILRSDDDSRSIENVVRLTAGNTLSIRGKRNLRLNGNITGDGGLFVRFVKEEDTLTLSGDSAYSGGTTIERGTLVLEDDKALGTGLLTVAGNTTIRSNSSERRVRNDIDITTDRLRFEGAFDLKLTGDISGAGRLVARSDGRLILTGDNTYTGSTRVVTGELQLLGSVAGTVNVEEEGLLTGDGSIGGNLDLDRRAQLNPGEGRFGTLDIGGDYTQARASALQIDLAADGRTDLLDIAGTAVLDEDSSIRTTFRSGGYVVSGQEYVVIDAAGGITDDGVNVVSESATLTVEIVEDPDFMDGDTEFRLVAERADDAYSNAATGNNNTAIGASLDTLISAADANPNGPQGDLLGSLDAFSEPVYDETLQNLSPVSYQAGNLIVFDNVTAFNANDAAYLRATREAATAWVPTKKAAQTPREVGGAQIGPGLRRLDPNIVDVAMPAEDTVASRRWGTFIKGYGLFNRMNSAPELPGYNADSVGVQAGIDYRFSPTLVVGVAGAYTSTDGDRSGDRGSLNIDTFRVGPYVTVAKGSWFLDGSFTYATHDFDATRRVPYLDTEAKGSYDGDDFTAYVATGIDIDLTETLVLTPLASFQYTSLDTDGFTESGGGSAGIRVDSRTDEAQRLRIGAMISGLFDVGLKFNPYLYAGWEHDFAGEEDYKAQFKVGGDSFSVTPADRDVDSAVIGAGVNVLVETNFTVFARFEAIWGDERTFYQVVGGVGFTF